MSKNLQNLVKFQKCQLENLVDFEKCCKTHIFLQKSEPIQPKTSNILPKFCQRCANFESCATSGTTSPSCRSGSSTARRSDASHGFVSTGLRGAGRSADLGDAAPSEVWVSPTYLRPTFSKVNNSSCQIIKKCA